MEPIFVETISTPLGKMQLGASSKGLVCLEFQLPNRNELWNKRCTQYFQTTSSRAPFATNLDQGKKWLKNFFADPSSREPLPSLDLRGTEFEKKVWGKLLKITPGKTISYLDLAKSLKDPNASRAVAGACRRNPIGIIVPCHRVIGSNGSLTGYGGGIENKKWLLDFESGH